MELCFLYCAIHKSLKILHYIIFLLTLARHESPQFSSFIGGVNSRPEITYFKLRNSPLEFISRKIEFILFKKIERNGLRTTWLSIHSYNGTYARSPENAGI